MRTAMLRTGVGLVCLLGLALWTAPEAEASPFKGLENALPTADVYVGFGFRGRSCRPCRRRVVRRRYYRRAPVRHYYYSEYPGYAHGYWSRPHYYYGGPSYSIGLGYHSRSHGHGYSRGRSYRGHSRGYHRGGSRRSVGRRR